MPAPIVFKGSYAYLLASAGLKFKDDVAIAEGSLNPQVTPVDALAGSVYISTSTLSVYIKTDNGSSTSWTEVTKNAAQVVTVAKSGAMFTSIQDAINSILDADAATKPYLVLVRPGVYAENITIKNGVRVRGDSGTVILQGTISGTITTSSGVESIRVDFTPTADNQKAVNITGGSLSFKDMTIRLIGSGDWIAQAVYLAAGTGYTVADSTVSDNRTGALSKDFIGWEFAGAGSYGISNVSVSDRTNAVGGNRCEYRVSGTGSVNMSGGSCTGITTNAAFAGTYDGFCVLSVGTAGVVRATNGLQIRLTGAGAGTAVGFRMNSGGVSSFQHVGTVVIIDGFTAGQEYLSDTSSADVQKLWIASANKDLPKSGSGTAIITPYDHQESGFVSWGAGTTYWSYVSGTKTITVTRAGAGIIKGAPVTWVANQAVVLTDLATNYIYMNSSGIIGATTTATKALYTDNIVLLEAWVQGTNIVVVKENHPYEFTTAVSNAWHNLFGALLQDATQTLAINSGAGRTVNVVGTNTLTDHGLDTAISAQTPATWLRCVTGTSGKTYLIATSSALGSKKSDPANTTGTNVANGRRLVIRLGVTKDSINSANAQFISMADTADYANLAAANNAIAAGSIAPFSPEIKALEVAQLGFAIINADGTGAGTLEQVTTALQVFGANFVSGGTSTSGSLITLSTTNFNGQLSGAETTVQAALDRLDDYGFISAYATGVEYRVGNPIVQNGCVYRCNTLVTAVANTAWTAVKASFTQVSIARYADVTAAEAANANDGDLCYVISTESFYRYVAAGGAYTRDGTYVLNTGDAGNTRRLAVAGKYVQGGINAIAGVNGMTGLSNAAPGTVSTSTGGQQGSSTLAARMDHNHNLGVHTHDSNSVGGPIKSNRIIITQANSFTAGQALYLNGTTYALAKADAAATAEVVGIVESSDGSTFTMITAGYITGLPAGTAGSNYFLSDATAGLITLTEPSTLGNISKPVVYTDTTTSGFVNIMRGVVVGGVNARASVSIPDGAGVNTIQDVSAYNGGVIEGYVYLDATTDLRGEYRIDFVKNGAGTYTASVSYTGDSVVTFSMTTDGLLQATLGGAKAGYASCVFNYAINAPAVGATFPLSVSAGLVLGRTDGAVVPAGYIGEVRVFNSVTVAAVTSGTTAGTVLDTLPAGRWRIDWIAVFGSATSSTGANVAIATNNANDTTGILSFAGSTASQTMYDLNFTSEVSGKPYVVDVATTQALYPKIRAFGADRNIVVRGQATRIA